MIAPDNMIVRKSISCRPNLWGSKMDSSGVTDSTSSRPVSRPESRMFMSSFRRAVKSACVNFPAGRPSATKRQNHDVSTSILDETQGIVTIGHIVPLIEVCKPQAEETTLGPVASMETREAMPVGRKLIAPKPTLNTIVYELDNELAEEESKQASMLEKSINKPKTATELRRSTYSVWPSPSPTPMRRPVSSVSGKPEKAAVAPRIPQKSAARKRSLVDMSEDLTNKREQIKGDIRTLRHKSSFLDETLKQTVHHRLAVVAEMEAMHQDLDVLDKPADSAISILSRPRPISRATIPRNSERPFWEARASSSLSMSPEIDPGASSESILLSPPDTPRSLEPRTTGEAKRVSVISAVPKRVSSLSKPRSQAVKRSMSLPQAKSFTRAESPKRIASEGQRLDKRMLQQGGGIASVRDSTFDKVIEMWKKFPASSSHLEECGR